MTAGDIKSEETFINNALKNKTSFYVGFLEIKLKGWYIQKFNKSGDPFQIHPYVEFCFCEDGSAVYEVENNDISLTQGKFVFIPSFSLHTYKIQKECLFNTLFLNIQASSIGVHRCSSFFPP